MTPDPRHGHLFDAASASGFGLDRLGVRPGHPPLGVARAAWETAYTRWVIAVDVTAVLLVGVAGVLLEVARTSTPCSPARPACWSP